jgi:DNA-binding response OmpR family regulator
MAEVLLVEDDPVIRGSLGRALSDRGHGIVYAATGMAGLEQVVAARPDVVILDLGLPDIDGAALLRMLRSVTETPVIVATARDDEAGIVACLKAGADDYVVKPFVMAELLARIEALLRRSGRFERGREERAGDITVDTELRTASRDGTPIALTRTEFDLLLQFIRHENRVLSKSQLLSLVWEYDEYESNLVEVHVSALRRKLERHGPRVIRTIRGFGYVFKP